MGFKKVWQFFFFREKNNKESLRIFIPHRELMGREFQDCSFSLGKIPANRTI